MEREDKKKAFLDAIFTNDPLGILQVKPAAAPPRTEEERLISSFREISDFYEKHGRLPHAEANDPQEHKLFSRLASLQKDEVRAAKLRPFDTYNVLGLMMAAEQNNATYTPPVRSLDDIWNDPLFGSIEEEDAIAGDLFNLRHVPNQQERAATDFVAKRKPCKNFDQYETGFKSVQNDLASGKRKLTEFKEENLREGQYYVHNGILLLLEQVDYQEKVQPYQSGSRTRKDGRTRVIFENGTESNMLYRSLYKSLLDNGYAITENETSVAEELARNFQQITDEDTVTGFIYVLKSLNPQPQIREIRHLYKIGYSTTPVEERVRNAAREATYLMADVSIVSVFQCYNLNPQRFEHLLHQFFGAVALKLDIFGENGQRYNPREWFVVPLPVIEQAIRFIISGDIVHYRYDDVREVLVRR